MLELKLRPDARAASSDGRSGVWRWVGLVIAGLGVGSGAVGAAVWTKDQDVLGAALVGAGISAAVTGTLMYFSSPPGAPRR